MKHDYITLYHGTSSVNLPSILANGLEPGHRHGADEWAIERNLSVGWRSGLRPQSVFLATDIKDARHFANLSVDEVGGRPVVLFVHVPKSSVLKLKADERGGSSLYTLLTGTPQAYRVEEAVPAAWIAKEAPTRRLRLDADDMVD